jgi:hypothetical protein
MSKPSIPHLAGAKVELPDDRYKSDMELHDRFQAFSSELLKLALAGIAVFGLFLTLLGSNGTESSVLAAMRSNSFFILACSSLVCFACSMALALVHRFLASDGMYHHLRAIKLLILLENRESNPNFDFALHESNVRVSVESDEDSRNRKFSKSEYALQTSALLLLVGATFLGIAFLRLLK